MFLTRIIIGFIICVVIEFASTGIHELGHINALYRTKKKLGLSYKTFKKVYIRGVYGKTLSDVYQYLSDRKNDKDIQCMIRINSIAGTIFEYSLLLISFLINLGVLLSFTKAWFNYLIFYTIIAHMLISLFSKNTSDIKTFKDPMSFIYNESLPATKNIWDQQMLTIGFMSVLTVLVVIFTL